VGRAVDWEDILNAEDERGREACSIRETFFARAAVLRAGRSILERNIYSRRRSVNIGKWEVELEVMLQVRLSNIKRSEKDIWQQMKDYDCCQPQLVFIQAIVATK
jgi:hypothetical protein